MSIYLDGLSAVLSAALWLSGALTPVVITGAAFAGLSGPYRRWRWKAKGRIISHRLRRQAAHGHTPRAS